MAALLEKLLEVKDAVNAVLRLSSLGDSLKISAEKSAA